jgi:hypothetical protein
LECAQGARDSGARAWGQAVRPNQTVEIVYGCERELDARHWLELVQRDRLAGQGLLAPLIRACKGSLDPVQQLCDVAGVGVSVIERA